MESIKEHFCQHRDVTHTWQEVKVISTEKKEVSQIIVDKGCLLVPMANLSYNFFEHKCVRDFITEVAEYRARTSQNQLWRLFDKLRGGQGKSLMRRLDTISVQFKSVCLYLTCDQFFIRFLIRFSDSVFQVVMRLVKETLINEKLHGQLAIFVDHKAFYFSQGDCFGVSIRSTWYEDNYRMNDFRLIFKKALHNSLF